MSEQISHLTRLSPDTITPQHLFWLAKICQQEYTGSQPVNYVQEWGMGLMDFWDFKCGQGLIMTQIYDHPSCKEFYIYGLAGDGILRNLRSVTKELVDYARSIGCNRLGGAATNSRTWAIYQKLLGVTKVSEKFMKEI